MTLTTTQPTSPSALAEPDCIGPIAIAPDLADELDGLAAGVAADDLVPFWVCASELVRRWPGGCSPVSARVIRERRTADTRPGPARPRHPDGRVTAPRTTGPAWTFRDALAGAASDAGDAGSGGSPADVTILISADGHRLYLERTGGEPTAGPALGAFARSYLDLLVALADHPDAPVTADTGTRHPGGTPVAAAP